MGAVSVSIGRPSRRSHSSNFAASATTSGPMPSPGRSTIFIRVERSAKNAHEIEPRPTPNAERPTSNEPRPLGQVLRLERADLVRVLKRQSDFVESVEQAVLGKGFDLETERVCPV